MLLILLLSDVFLFCIFLLLIMQCPCIQVNEHIIKYACVLYNCDLCETKHSEFLASCGKCLKERSGIDYEGWSTMKLATALRILCFPDDDESYDDLVNHNIL